MKPTAVKPTAVKPTAVKPTASEGTTDKRQAVNDLVRKAVAPGNLKAADNTKLMKDLLAELGVASMRELSTDEHYDAFLALEKDLSL